MSTTCMIVILGLFQPNNLAAQSFMQSWSNDSQIGFEWYHPSFSGSSLSALTSVSFISLDVPVGRNLRLKADLPLSYYNWTDDQDPGQLAAGDPYIGIEHRMKDPRFSIDLGIRLPLSERAFSFVDENSVYYRFAASDNQAWVLRANLHYLRHLPSGFSFQFLFGSFAEISNASSRKTLWYLNYGAHMRYRHHQFLVGAGIKGIASLTEPFSSSVWNGQHYQRNTSHQFYFEIGSPHPNWTPSLYLAFPFDDNVAGSEQLNFVLGLRANIHLPA
ncbi:MAG TPA: hypothetical protein VKA08_07680 [Balneolales bacterium]|nr:hypothetical protein [Balneolales bacterium]